MKARPDRRFPDFLYIGASRSGSTWIYEVLREHPQVFVPAAKEIQFFDRYYDRGTDWYLGFFAGARNRLAAGEVAHDYFLSAETARRIRSLLPKVRLICCLREPFSRTLSGFLFNKTTQLEEEVPFAEYAARPDILKQSDYYNNLLPFYELFGRESILVLFFDELKDDPASFIRRIYEFLGVDAGFVPPSLKKVVLPARRAKSGAVARLAYDLGQRLRDAGLANLVGAIKRSPFLQRLLYRPIERKPDIPAEERERLVSLFRKDYGKLASLIGRDLPGAWTGN